MTYRPDLRNATSRTSNLVTAPLRRPIAFVLVALGAAAAACTTASSSSTSTSSSTTSTRSSVVKAPQGYRALVRDKSPLAKADNDQGRVDGTAFSAGSVYLKPSAARLAARAALVDQVQDKKSPNYHKWIGADEYAQRFGATDDQVAKVTAYLQSQGLKVDAPSRTRSRVGYHGTTAQVEAAFNAEMHHYLVNGQMHTALSNAPALPTAIADSVLGIRGTHDFHPKAHLLKAPVAPKPNYTDKNAGLVLGPADFQVLYDTKPLLSAGVKGNGVNLAIVGQTMYMPSDLAQFRKTFDLNATSQHDVLVPGTGASKVNDAGDLGETELDLEWAQAVAPDTNIIFVYTGDNTTNYSVGDSAAYIIEQGNQLIPGVGNGGAQIISESYGSCEAVYPADSDIDGEIASAANLEGITYIAASGDSGATGCLEFGIGGLFTGPPASLPGVTGVGGTEFGKSTQKSPYFSSSAALEYPATGAGVSLESVWNDQTDDPMTSEGAGGGGVSILFPKPFYQQGVTPSDNARDVPDVSLTASPANVGYEVYEDNNGTSAFFPVGGTSAATPSFAAIMAMVNQQVLAGGGALGLGNINPELYSLAKSHPAAFHDIVTGNNNTPCDPTDSQDFPDCPSSGTYGGFAAGPGYDIATGLGTIDANELVTAWAALTPTTTTIAPNVTTATVNTAVTLSATIATKGTTAMTGNVSFTFQTFAGKLGLPYDGDSGGADETWILGTAPITATAAGGATATLTTMIPPGLYGSANVVAMYSGDAKYLASVSAQVPMTITGSTLTITPATITLAPGQTTTFQTTGGSPPLLWETFAPDTTCVVDQSTGMENCSQVEAETTTEGYFQAGPHAGTVNVIAIDTQGQEAVVAVTVTGTPVDGGTFPMFDAGPAGGPGATPTTPIDASIPVLLDSGATGDDSGVSLGDDDDSGTGTTTPVADAGSGSGSGETGSSSSSGCSTSGRTKGQSTRENASLLALVGLVFAARRRVSKNASKKTAS